MKFKLNVLLVIFIFLLSGCGGSDAPSMTTPEDTDGDGVSDNFDAMNTLARTTERVSVASNGTQGNSYSSNPAISGDGRYVAFSSFAMNLVADDTNELSDIFVHDRDTGITERVSISSCGCQSNNLSYRPDISSDGLHVAFASNAMNLVADDTNGLEDIFVHSRTCAVLITAVRLHSPPCADQ